MVGHVALEPSRYAQLAQGSDDYPAQVAGLPEYNATRIRNLPTRNLAELAEKACADTDHLITLMTAFGDQAPTMAFDGGHRVPADLAMGILLGEFVVYGHDLARELGRRWPIFPEHVRMIFDGPHQVIAGWVDADRAAGHTATYELRLRRLAHYVYSFSNGALETGTYTPDTIDVHISAEPTAALLTSTAGSNPGPQH